MKYVRYGNIAAFVLVLAFGTVTLGEKNKWNIGVLNQELSDRIVKECIDMGINLLDTADV